ncbi:unnamed protein product [Macrosiphum euphorbiae]|uniref:Uncharacterized protein n=1 Tax=Macrosiphum euphorbiae TaxID=13131 RepID=A0AAV0WDV3_9HEMI|nr:unnamed protein product [Macrosiphum euphorbiae]
MQNINNENSINQDCGYIFPNNFNFCQNNNNIAVSQTTFPTMNFQSNDESNIASMIIPASETNSLPQYSISDVQLQLSEKDSSDVRQLLISWNLNDIIDTCLKELIDISILKSMSQSQSEKLLSSFPYGIKIKFWNSLKTWQNTFNVDNTNCSEHEIAKNNYVIDNTPVSLIEKSLINLASILNDYSQGKLIVDYFKNHGKLNDACRNILHKIFGAFPTEIKEIYFVRGTTNTSPKGKLYAKYYNSLRALKKGGLLQKSKKSYNSNILTRSELESNFESETDIDDHLSSIRHNTCAWPDMEIHWQATIKYRLNHIQTCESTKSIMDYWPNYKMPLGYKLIDIDFKFKFSQCENMLTNYDKIFDKFLSLIKIKVKDPASQKVLTEMENTDIDENRRNACFFYLLHSDSQSSFIIFAHTVEEIEETISSLKEKGDPIQPFVMVVGTIIKPKEILVFFDYAKFKVYSVVRAVDICFKIIHLFHLKYPLQCTMVWHFLQKMLYKLETPYDTVLPQVSKIISELN